MRSIAGIPETVAPSDLNVFRVKGIVVVLDCDGLIGEVSAIAKSVGLVKDKVREVGIRIGVAVDVKVEGHSD